MTSAPEGTVYVVDDDPAIREAIAVLARSVHLPVREFDSALAFLEAYTPAGPACLVTDVCLPGMDGLELQQVLAERDPGLPVIVVSGHGDIAMAVEMMRRGALDFIEKPFRNHILLERLREALERDAERWRRQRAGLEAAQRLIRLTPRENEVARHLARGESNKQVARAFALSPRTVEAHRANILRKLEVRSVAELATLLLAAGAGTAAAPAPEPGSSTESPP